MRGKRALVAALLLAAMPALAQTEPAATAPEPAPKPAKVKVKKICRSAIPTGRRIAESTCLTQAEWDEQDAVDRAAAQGLISQLVRQGSTPAASPNPMTGR